MKGFGCGTLLLLIVGLAFVSAAAVVFVRYVKPVLEAEYIIENGKEATATVININSNIASGKGANKTSYYYIEFSFVNAEGKTVALKTGSIFDEYDLVKLGIAEYDEDSYQLNIVLPVKEIPIMYRGKNAVPKNYVPESVSWDWWIIIIFFGGGGIGVLITFVLVFTANVKHSNTEQLGKDGIGVYLEHSLKYSTGGKHSKTPYFSICFAFKNDAGKIIETKTKGKAYNKQKAEEIAALKVFPIKYIGDNAVIMEESLNRIV